MGHTRSQADRLADLLRELPAAKSKRQFSKQEMVSYLSAEIIGLQERGYTSEAIAAALRAGGLEITGPTLKTYLSRTKRNGRSRGRKVRVGRAVPEAATQPISRAVN
jgi:hypothetical protein